MTLRNLDLEALIVANPDSRDGYILYSDWLQQHGDPRGEFIAVQLARESQPHDAMIADRERELLTGGLRAHVLESIAAAAWPELESLVICFGTPDYGGTCTTDDLAAILDGANLPQLTTLGLWNGEFADELAELVAASRILPRLVRLDLSKGTLGDAGAGALIANARAFGHLELLDLSENFLTEGVCAEIRKVLSNVDVSRQKAADGYGRFVSVSE